MLETQASLPLGRMRTGPGRATELVKARGGVSMPCGAVVHCAQLVAYHRAYFRLNR